MNGLIPSAPTYTALHNSLPFQSLACRAGLQQTKALPRSLIGIFDASVPDNLLLTRWFRDDGYWNAGCQAYLHNVSQAEFRSQTTEYVPYLWTLTGMRKCQETLLSKACYVSTPRNASDNTVAPIEDSLQDGLVVVGRSKHLVR